MTGKFVASYSCGKDSALAVWRAMRQGLEPVAYLTAYNIGKERSWFHGVDKSVLERVSRAAEVPLLLAETDGQDYAESFEKALLAARELGAQTCVFGDIDIDEHITWCTRRCENTGLIPLFPLFRMGREAAVRELIESGFTARITVVNTKKLSADFLGEVLTKETAQAISRQGADVCGENGEYHTFVSDGPIFRQPVNVSFGERIFQDGYAILPLAAR